MTTIAKAVIEARFDAQGMKGEIVRMEQQLKRLRKFAEADFRMNFRYPEMSRQIKAAQTLLGDAQRNFTETFQRIREGSARGLINPQQLQKETRDAINVFNKEILDGIDKLEKQGLLTPSIRAQLSSQLKDIGVNGAAALRQGFAASPLLGNLTTQGQRAANSLINGLRQTYNSQIQDLRTRFAENAISVNTFRRKSLEAANAFDHGLAQGLRGLQARGLATKNITEAITKEFRLAGTRAANAFQESARRQLGANITQIGGTLSLGVTAPLALAGRAAINLAKDFDLSMRRVRISLKPTGDEFKALIDQSRALGAATQFSANEVAQAQISMARNTFSVNQTLSATPQIVALAAATLSDMAEAGQTAAVTMRSTNTPFERFGDVVDVLAFLTNRYSNSLGELETAFRTVGQVGVGAGQNFDTLAAAIAHLSSAGLRGTIGATALRGLLLRLIDPSKEASAALERLNIDIKDPIKGMKDLFDIIEQFQKAKIEKPQQFDEFLKDLAKVAENRTSVALLSFINRGAASLRNLREEMTQTGGVAAQFGDIQMKGLAGAFRQFENVVQEVMLSSTIDTGLSVALADLIRKFSEVIKIIANLNPSLLQFVIIMGAIAAAIGPVVLVLGLLITNMAALMAIMIQLNGAFTYGAFVSAMKKGSWFIVGILAVGTALGFLASKALAARVAMSQWEQSLQVEPVENLQSLVNTLTKEIQLRRGLIRAIGGKEIRLKSGVYFENALKDPTGPIAKTIKKFSDEIEHMQEQLLIADKALSQRRTINARTQQETDERTAQMNAEIQALMQELQEGLNKGLESGTDKMQAFIGKVSDAVRLMEALNFRAQAMPELTALLGAQYDVLINKMLTAKKLTIAQRADLLELKTRMEELFSKLDFRPILTLDQVEQTLANLPEVKIQLTPTLAPALKLDSFEDELFKQFNTLVAQLENQKVTLDFARMTGNPELIAGATRDYEDAVQRLKQAEKDLAVVMTILNVPAQRRKEILEAIKKATTELGEEESAAAKNLRKFASKLESLAVGVRGIISIADAFGLVNETVRQVATGIVNAIDALAEFNKQKAAKNVAGQVSALFGIAGGIFDVLSAFSALDDESQRIMRENNAELAKLRLEIRGWRNSVGEVSSLQTNVMAVIASLGDALDIGGTTGAVIRKIALSEITQLTGLSKLELEKIAKDFGITLFDNGKLVGGALEALAEALELNIIKLTRFGESLADQQNRLDLRRDLFNLPDDSASIIQEQLNLLKSFAPDLFQKFFANIDFATEEGRKQAEIAFQKLFEFIDAGLLTQFPELLGKFTGLEELLTIIRTFAGAMDEARQATEELTEGLLNVPSGFKVERARFLATLSDVITRIPDLPPRPPTDPGVVTEIARESVINNSVTYVFEEGAIQVDARDKSSGEIFEAVRAEAQRRARSIGPISRASETLDY